MSAVCKKIIRVLRHKHRNSGRPSPSARNCAFAGAACNPMRIMVSPFLTNGLDTTGLGESDVMAFGLKAGHSGGNEDLQWAP